MTNPDNNPYEVIQLADGHVMALCCGAIDGDPHRNFCKHYRATVAVTATVPSVVTSTTEAPVVMAPEHDPEWCTIDHAEDDDRDDLVLHMGDDHTDRSVRTLLNAHRLSLRIAQADDVDAFLPGKPTLMVHVDVELTTWEQAAELARTILDGFGYLKGA
jgi:hypothetical protein